LEAVPLQFSARLPLQQLSGSKAAGAWVATGSDMLLFSKPNKNVWHRQVATSGATECMRDWNPGAFPHHTLRTSTEDYIKRKKLVKGSEACDSHLEELIREHVEQEKGCLETAILACQPGFSKFAAIASLIKLRGDDEGRPRIAKYLRCLVVAHKIAPSHFSQPECRIAETLLAIRSLDEDDIAHFRSIVLDLGLVANSLLLPTIYINRILDYCEFRARCKVLLKWLQTRRRFVELHDRVAWIKAVPRLAFPQTAMAVLNVQMPDLHLWTTWRPNVHRLQRWEDGHLSRPQRERLVHIFDLEGPDLTGLGCATYKEAGPACLRGIRLSHTDPRLMYLLLDTLDRAQGLGGHGVELFLFLCVDKAASTESLAFVAKMLATNNEHCCKSALALLTSASPGVSADCNDRMVALTDGLLLMGAYETLRAEFDEHIADDVVTSMRAAQRNYCIQLAHGMAENIGFKIRAFGAAIRDASWLQADLPEAFLQNLQTFPTFDVLRGIIAHVQKTPVSKDRMAAYLAASLGGNGTDVGPLLATVQQEQQFWAPTTEPERAKIIQAIRNLPYMKDIDFVLACHDRILTEEVVLLREILPLIVRNSELSCVEFLRVLGRRLELKCAVHEIWITLLYVMIENRIRSLLEWSCENLRTEEWFRWFSDLQLVYPSDDNRVAQASFGLTDERRNWWARLSGQYADAVRYLEARQGAEPSLKWLYLDQIANVDALLDAIHRRRALESFCLSILAYFEPNPLVISSLCDCFASLGRISPLGRASFRSVLARQELPPELWPNTATQSFLLGWLRSPDLTAEDKVALNHLAQLMEMQPLVHRAGFAAAKNRLLGDYHAAIATAQKLEAMRMSLRLDDARRTSALLTGLGVQDSRGVVDPDIPDDLIDVVERIGDREYEMCFPLTGVAGHVAKMRGVGESARLLLVTISFLPRPGFCLHLSTGQDVAGQHIYWMQGGLPPVHRVCTTALDPFTYLLSRRIHRLLRNDHVSLQSIHEEVSQILRNPASACLVCASALEANVWRPTICGLDRCRVELDRAPLAVKFNGFLADPPVVDFLLACVYAAAQDVTTLDLLPGCPIEKSMLPAVINSFPAMPPDTTAQALLNRIGGTDEMAQHREVLMSWMCTTFRGSMLSAPSDMGVPLMPPGVQQFLMFNASPELEKAFAARLPSGTGGPVFHGTPAPRLWRVLTGGLRNMTDGPFMIHGAVNGPGIYLAQEPSVSLGYSGVFTTTWRHSAFTGKTVLLGCELEGHTDQATHVVPEEARVLVRFIILGPPGFTAPQARLIGDAMKTTFAALRVKA